LAVVATPIGHLDDLSPRALEVLRASHRIVAEDTRRTRKLLAHFDLHVPLISCHAHNERGRVPFLVDCLKRGERLALVSDAGTPLLSDPGCWLVAAAHEAGFRVTPVPGPSAVLAALSVAGFPAARFHFEGFLPPRGPVREARLRALSGVDIPLVFFDSPVRLERLVDELAGIFGPDRKALLAREMTKQHETIHRASLAELRTFLASQNGPTRGEVVVVVEAAAEWRGGETAHPPDERLDRVLRLLLDSLSPSRAATVASTLLDLPRSVAYRRVLDLRGKAASSP
jgi:16S rRNA (cytidine1402-2'-O)-methyltransferase